MAHAEPAPSKKDRSQVLDPTRRSNQVSRFEAMLRERVIGQVPAIDAILDSFSKVLAGIRNPERPILTLLFLGPTGVGKTETVKALAETIFGKRNAFTRVNCQEFSSEFTVSKLFGSPPGYVGNDVEPMLSQDNLDKHHKEAQSEGRGVFAEGEGKIARLFPQVKSHFLSIVLFDEVEKAHPKLWNALLGLMEDGHLTLGNNKTVDFTRSVIVITTNVGAEEMSATLRHRSIGFEVQREAEAINHDIKTKAVEAAKEVFPYEFLNRFDDIICFRVLTSQDLRKILNLMLQDVYKRLLGANMPIILHYSPAYLDKLQSEGTDPQFGARPMRRAVERMLVAPLSRLIASGQVKAGDIVSVRLRGGEPSFTRDGADPKKAAADAKVLR
ncbi:MAG: ATP-dependent Clp protease ATP-binding subunit [Planctomycetes bacterium]|jgi:ATP-dependent Clp protease ATP-binding subunit ClpA|nr:ATP-dependent Clp protease ATP-binding subunit [Planctomycetota bacterium]